MSIFYGVVAEYPDNPALVVASPPLTFEAAADLATCLASDPRIKAAGVFMASPCTAVAEPPPTPCAAAAEGERP